MVKDLSEGLVGQTFHYLTIVGDGPIKVYKNQNLRTIRCKCKCGNYTNVNRSQLLVGKVKSCGCYHKEVQTKRFYKHGLSEHPLYRIWIGIIDRCYNKKHRYYDDYGGRGIKVCKEWQKDKTFTGLINFISWNEGLPNKNKWNHNLEIDREDNNKDYDPDNCRWVTHKVNMSNRRNTFMFDNDKSISFKDFWIENHKENVSYALAAYRYKKGWSIDSAVTQPPKTIERTTMSDKKKKSAKKSNNAQLWDLTVQTTGVVSRAGVVKANTGLSILLNTKRDGSSLRQIKSIPKAKIVFVVGSLAEGEEANIYYKSDTAPIFRKMRRVEIDGVADKDTGFMRGKNERGDNIMVHPDYADLVTSKESTVDVPAGVTVKKKTSK